MTEPTGVTAPVDYLVVEFPGNRFNGKILPELGRLIAAGTVRVLDLAFVSKNADGDVTFGEIEHIDAIDADAWKGLEQFLTGLVSRDDLDDVAAALEPDSSAAVVVWENSWAADFIEALRGSGAELVSSGRIPYDALVAAHDD